MNRTPAAEDSGSEYENSPEFDQHAPTPKSTKPKTATSSTTKQRTPARVWTEDDDATLIRMRHQKKTYKQIGEVLGRADTACSTRYGRLPDARKAAGAGPRAGAGLGSGTDSLVRLGGLVIPGGNADDTRDAPAKKLDEAVGSQQAPHPPPPQPSADEADNTANERDRGSSAGDDGESNQTNTEPRDNGAPSDNIDSDEDGDNDSSQAAAEPLNQHHPQSPSIGPSTSSPQPGPDNQRSATNRFNFNWSVQPEYLPDDPDQFNPLVSADTAGAFDHDKPQDVAGRRCEVRMRLDREAARASGLNAAAGTVGRPDVIDRDDIRFGGAKSGANGRDHMMTADLVDAGLEPGSEFDRAFAEMAADEDEDVVEIRNLDAEYGRTMWERPEFARISWEKQPGVWRNLKSEGRSQYGEQA